MVRQRGDNIHLPFGPGAPMPAARPPAPVVMTSAPHATVHASTTGSRRLESATAPQWSPSATAPRQYSLAHQRLLYSLQPPANTNAGGALRPSISTTYRTPWTRHSTASSSSSTTHSNGSRVSSSSSPRYSDLLDAINEANAAGTVTFRRSHSSDSSSHLAADRIHRRSMDDREVASLPSRKLSGEFNSPTSHHKSSHLGKHPADKLASSPSSYPLAPKEAGNSNDSSDNGEQGSAPKKRVRYLRDTDRRNIIRRIENGEKQAALAREFGVTRAAICHIKKNRYEIISRYDMLVKTAKEMDKQESYGIPPGAEVMVQEVRSKPVVLLLTTLRDRRTPPSLFRRTAGRLIMILLEEAFASLESEAVHVPTSDGRTYEGLQTKYPFCGIGIGSEGLPFLVLLSQMDPDAPRGSLKIEQTNNYRNGALSWRVENVDLPSNIAELKVLLFISTCATGDSVVKAIEILRGSGVEESDISVVMIWCAADGLAVVCNRFPRVRVVTAAIDSKMDDREPEGLGDFVARYNDRIDPAPPTSGFSY